MTKATYQRYLESPHWRSFRARVLCNRPRRCEQCGVVGEPLELHHHTYERLGAELESDVRLLCRICHGSKHIDKLSEPLESAFNIAGMERGRRNGWRARL
jgi:5-methylcytosine-specific restriction endonuclease McrA